jgi:hypothetical protein
MPKIYQRLPPGEDLDEVLAFVKLWHIRHKLVSGTNSGSSQNEDVDNVPCLSTISWLLKGEASVKIWISAVLLWEYLLYMKFVFLIICVIYKNFHSLKPVKHYNYSLLSYSNFATQNKPNLVAFSGVSNSNNFRSWFRFQLQHSLQGL